MFANDERVKSCVSNFCTISDDIKYDLDVYLIRMRLEMMSPSVYLRRSSLVYCLAIIGQLIRKDLARWLTVWRVILFDLEGYS